MKITTFVSILLISLLFLFSCSSNNSEKKNENQTSENKINEDNLNSDNKTKNSNTDVSENTDAEDDIDKICEVIDNNIDNNKYKETILTSKCTEFTSIDSVSKYANEKGELQAVIVASETDDFYEWSEYYLDKNKIICVYNYYETYNDNDKIDYEEYYSYFKNDEIFFMWGKTLTGDENSYDAFEEMEFEDYEYDATEENTYMIEAYTFLKNAKTSKDLVTWFCETE